MRKCALSLLGLLVGASMLVTLVPVVKADTPKEDWGNIDWQQAKGTTLSVLATSMPVAEVYKARIAKFEELTGIKVNFEMTKGVNPAPQLIAAKYGEAADIVSREMSNVIAGIKDVPTAAKDAQAALEKLGYKPPAM